MRVGQGVGQVQLHGTKPMTSGGTWSSIGHGSGTVGLHESRTSGKRRSSIGQEVGKVGLHESRPKTS